MLNVQEWKSAMAKAEGKKVQDDPNLLKKTIKRKEKQKKKSTEEWLDFILFLFYFYFIFILLLL